MGDIFIIKKENYIYYTIDNYFFEHIEQINSDIKLFFLENKMIDNKQLSKYFFKLPFQFLFKILSSIDNKGTYFLQNIMIPESIW